MPVSRSPEQLAVRTVESGRPASRRVQTRSFAKLLIPWADVLAMKTDCWLDMVVLLLCGETPYHVALTIDKDNHVAGITLRLRAKGKFSRDEREVFDRIQATAKVARIDPDEESREIRVEAHSKYKDQDDVGATLDFLAEDIGLVVLDDRLRGLVQA